MELAKVMWTVRRRSEELSISGNTSADLIHVTRVDTPKRFEPMIVSFSPFPKLSLRKKLPLFYVLD